jgi:hypothetical protein
VFVTSSLIQRILGTLATFVDGGASFSAIGLEFIREHGLEHLIVPPSRGELPYLYYANKHMKTKRLGKIELPVSVHFLDSNRRTLHFTLKFEVADLPWDFLFGAEVKDIMFPHSEMAAYGAAVSSIASEPTNVSHTTRDGGVIERALQENAVNLPDILATLRSEAFPQASSESATSSSSSSTSSSPLVTAHTLISHSSLTLASPSASHDDAPREQ